MTALAAPREMAQMNGPNYIGPIPVAAGKVFYPGALVVLNATGFAEPATAAAAKVALGVFDFFATLATLPQQKFNGQAATFQNPSAGLDNTAGADGAFSIVVRPGVFRFKNKGGDLATPGTVASIEDDQTVRATAAGSSTAGTVIQKADDGTTDVYVQIFGYAEAV